MFGGKPSFKERSKRISRVDFKRSNAGRSRKCECEARLVVRLPTTYARELGLTTLGAASCNVPEGCPSRQPNEAPAAPLAATVTRTTAAGTAVGGMQLAGAGADVFTPAELANPGVQGPPQQDTTTIRVRLYLEHTKHTPFSPEDLIRQPVHPAIAEKVIELTMQGVPSGLLKELLHSFADKLVETLGTPRNLGDNRFYPRPETLRNLRDAAMRKSRAHNVDQEACKNESQQKYPPGGKCGRTNRTLADLPLESVLQPRMNIDMDDVTQRRKFNDFSANDLHTEVERLVADTNASVVQEEECLEEEEEEKGVVAAVRGSEANAGHHQDNTNIGRREMCRELAMSLKLFTNSTFHIPSSYVRSLQQLQLQQQQQQGFADSMPSYHVEIPCDFTHMGCKRRKLAPPHPLLAITPLMAQQQPPSAQSQLQAAAMLSHLQATAAAAMPTQLQAEVAAAAALAARSQLQPAMVPSQLQVSTLTVAAMLS
ncbi:hypothetical protein Vretimale_14796 [Volvox reticuliferus]|nr:hypothetical protein Vretifemale_20378 [Volvox reticuliferus]GIM11272.1 hypothetical protein Vretimale_14796 [Volvox reticuliferus]